MTNAGARQRRRSASQAETALSPRSKGQEQVLSKALKMLSARPHTETQLRERLTSKTGAQSEIIDECVSKLKELGLLNDKRFAESYASHRLSLKPMGRSRLVAELASKKVRPDDIHSALDSVFEETAEDVLIDRAIRKRIRTHGSPVGERDARQMFGHLSRLGFDYDLIIRRIKALRKPSRNYEGPDEP